MRLIDLTLPLADGETGYPGDPPVLLRQTHGLRTHGWRLHQISLGSHAGTHVNAPWHMAEDGARLEELPLSGFVAWAVVAGHGEALPGPGPEHGLEHGLKSGPPATGNAPTVKPGLGVIFADQPLRMDDLPALIAARPAFVGQAAEFPIDLEVERALCQAGIISFENLANTGQLPRGRKFLFAGLPLAVTGDGAPVRAVAMLGVREEQP